MSRQVTIDFTGTTPIQLGGGFGDHIPAGKYAMKISRVEESTSSNGNRMWRVMLTVAEGDYIGKRVPDNFTLEGDSPVGKQRCMTFLRATGLDVRSGRVQLDLDMLPGRPMIVEVADDLMRATDRYPERVVSRPIQYYRLDGSDPTKDFSENGAAPAQAVAPDPVADAASAAAAAFVQ